MSSCSFNTLNTASTETDHLRKNHLSVVSNGKVDEKAEEARRSLIKSMSRRNTPNAVMNKWKPIQEKATKDILRENAPRSSALRSLELFEKRKSITDERRFALEEVEREKKAVELERRKAKRAELLKRYSLSTALETRDVPNTFRRETASTSTLLSNGNRICKASPTPTQNSKTTPASDSGQLSPSFSRTSLPPNDTQANSLCSTPVFSPASKSPTPLRRVYSEAYAPSHSSGTTAIAEPVRNAENPSSNEVSTELVNPFAANLKVTEPVVPLNPVDAPVENQEKSASNAHVEEEDHWAVPEPTQSPVIEPVEPVESTLPAITNVQSDSPVELTAQPDSVEQSTSSPAASPQPKPALDFTNANVSNYKRRFRRPVYSALSEDPPVFTSRVATPLDTDSDFDISKLSKSGQAILKYGSVNSNVSRTSSRSSVSDRLKRYESLEANAMGDDEVLNAPNKSIKQSYDV